jgi:hypothetical protein
VSVLGVLRIPTFGLESVGVWVVKRVLVKTVVQAYDTLILGEPDE